MWMHNHMKIGMRQNSGSNGCAGRWQKQNWRLHSCISISINAYWVISCSYWWIVVSAPAFGVAMQRDKIVIYMEPVDQSVYRVCVWFECASTAELVVKQVLACFLPITGLSLSRQARGEYQRYPVPDQNVLSTRICGRHTGNGDFSLSRNNLMWWCPS